MTGRGDLLALVDGAPGRLTTLQGALTTWTHRERAAIVRVRALEQAGESTDQLAQVTTLPGGSRWDTDAAEHSDDVEDAGEDSARNEVGDPGNHASGATDAVDSVDPGRRQRDGDREAEGAETLTSWYVVVALPDRWRVVGRGHLAVSDGRRSWAGTSTLVTERDSTRAAIHDAGVIGACLYPGALLGGLELATPEAVEIDGRPCWLVDAHPRPDVSGTSLASSAAPHALRLHRDLVGIDHRVWFDAATGILLRHEGFVDGEICSSTQLTDLVFDAPIADGEFRPPPGAVVRSRHELLRDHLSEMGVDPDTVDLDDPAQVREALRQGG
jgi:hypothetical protein